jgi:hypothetical protein
VVATTEKSPWVVEDTTEMVDLAERVSYLSSAICFSAVDEACFIFRRKIFSKVFVSKIRSVI